MVSWVALQKIPTLHYYTNSKKSAYLAVGPLKPPIGFCPGPLEMIWLLPLHVFNDIPSIKNLTKYMRVTLTP